MEFGQFINDLKQRLTGPLPGQEAQRVMAPFETDNARFDLGRMKDARDGAVLVLFFESHGGVRFPLIQRPEYDGVHSGQIALPGGKKEDSDKDLLVTALREAQEEIGIDPSMVSIIGTLTELYIPVSNFKVLPVIGYSKEIPRFEADHKEVEDIIMADLNNLLFQERRITKIRISEEFQINAPYFDLDQRILWGATAMMLGELFALIKN